MSTHTFYDFNAYNKREIFYGTKIFAEIESSFFFSDGAVMLADLI